MITLNSNGAPINQAAWTAAATADNRTPKFKVYVNWGRIANWAPNPMATGGGTIGGFDDISKYVLNIQTQADLTTDVPENTRLVTGQAVRQATISLGGDPDDNDRHAAILWSAYASAAQSPFAGKKRVGARVQVFYSFDGLTDWVSQFKGWVRSLKVSTDQMTATLQAFDSSDRLGNPVRLPTWLANQTVGAVDVDGTPLNGSVVESRFGANSQWLIDYCLRQNDKFCSPPTGYDYGTIASLTMHGSTFPEYGLVATGATIKYADGTALYEPPQFAQGPFALAVAPRSGTLSYVALDPQVLNALGGNQGAPTAGINTSLAGFQHEFWLKTPASWSGAGRQNVYSTLTSSTNGQYQKVFVQDDGNVYATVGNASTAAQQKLTSSALPTNTWVYVGVHMFMATATSNTVHYNINGVTGISTISGFPAWSTRAVDFYEFLTAYPVEAVHVRRIQTNDFSARTFVPDAYLEPGLNELQFIPYVDDKQDAWTLVQAVAAAECGAAGFDETDVFRFFNRQHFITSAGATPVITYDDDLMISSLATTESVDSIINTAQIVTTQYVLEPDEWVWRTQHQRGIHTGETMSLWITFDDQVTGIASGWMYMRAGGILPTKGFNAFRAWSPYPGGNIDDPKAGGGTNIGLSASANDTHGVWPTVDAVYPKAARISFKNNFGHPIYMIAAAADDQGTAFPAENQGQPFIWVSGQRIINSLDADVPEGQQPVTTDDLTATVTNTGSAADYGTQTWKRDASDWMQDLTSARNLGTDIVNQLYLPTPTFDDMTLDGDGRIQLGDNLGAVSTIMNASTNGYAIGIKTQMDGAKFTQTLSVRGALPPPPAASGWVLGDPINSILGQTTLVQ